MRQVVLIVRRELLEQRRQPWMIAVIGVTFILFGGLLLPPLWLFEQVYAIPELQPSFSQFYPGDAEVPLMLEIMANSLISVGNNLLFAQLVGVCAVLSGHGILHDRQCHTLPFLLLAPLRRVELLVGKVLGAMLLPTLIYWVIGVLFLGLAARFPLVAENPGLPTSAAWWGFYFLSAPAWTFAVCTVCVLLGHRSSDVRTAQQGVWFVVLLGVLLGQFLLVERLADGVVFQGVMAIGCVLLSVALLFVGRFLTR